LKTFQLKQQISKEVPLDLGLYSKLMSDFTEKSPSFEEIAENYTKESFYLYDEPLPLYFLGQDRVLFKIEAISKQIDLECRKLKASMLTLKDLSDIGDIVSAMKKNEVSKIPLMLFIFQGILSNMQGNHIANPPSTADLTKTNSWVKLLDTGLLDYPTTDESNQKMIAFCEKPKNLWDRGDPERNTFIHLMKQLKTQFKPFNTGITKFSKYLGNTIKVNNSRKIYPPFELTRLNNLITKFANPTSWQSTLSTDYGTFVEIF
jgi:hypothetical protein